MKRAAWVLAAALGAAIWIASPYVTGRREPWDAASPYYPLALLGAGAVMGWLGSGGVWRWAVAIYVGQCAAVLALTWSRHEDLGLFVPMGMVVLAAYTALSLAGGAAAAWLRTRWPAGRG